MNVYAIIIIDNMMVQRKRMFPLYMIYLMICIEIYNDYL